jgi:hypothetical protein
VDANLALAFMQLHLHPKSLYELPDTWQGMRELQTYGEGVAVLAKEETREEMEERVRFFAEESDHLQVNVVSLNLTSLKYVGAEESD